jgi:cell division protease FtsH
MALGYTKPLTEDRSITILSNYTDEMAVLMGGRAAEELIFDEKSTGAASDIKRATNLARAMVTDFGMSDKLGPRTFGNKQELVFLGREISEQRDYGDKVADTIDDEVNRLIENAYSTAKRILTENRVKLVQLAERLMVKETLEGEELDALFNDQVPPLQGVAQVS